MITVCDKCETAQHCGLHGCQLSQAKAQLDPLGQHPRYWGDNGTQRKVRKNTFGLLPAYLDAAVAKAEKPTPQN